MTEEDYKDFAREELREITERADLQAMISTHPHWVTAWHRLAEAAFILDAFYARSEK